MKKTSKRNKTLIMWALTLGITTVVVFVLYATVSLVGQETRISSQAAMRGGGSFGGGSNNSIRIDKNQRSVIQNRGEKQSGSPACSDGKKDIQGVCNEACCGNDGECPSGESCSIGNGYCKSGKSCGVAASRGSYIQNKTENSNPVSTTPTNRPIPSTGWIREDRGRESYLPDDDIAAITATPKPVTVKGIPGTELSQEEKELQERVQQTTQQRPRSYSTSRGTTEQEAVAAAADTIATEARKANEEQETSWINYLPLILKPQQNLEEEPDQNNPRDWRAPAPVRPTTAKDREKEAELQPKVNPRSQKDEMLEAIGEINPTPTPEGRRPEATQPRGCGVFASFSCKVQGKVCVELEGGYTTECVDSNEETVFKTAARQAICEQKMYGRSCVGTDASAQCIAGGVFAAEICEAGEVCDQDSGECKKACPYSCVLEDTCTNKVPESGVCSKSGSVCCSESEQANVVQVINPQFPLYGGYNRIWSEDRFRNEPGYCEYVNGSGWNGSLSLPFNSSNVAVDTERLFVNDHPAVDFGLPQDADVLAAAPGVVVARGSLSGYGPIVILDHGDGYRTVYLHLQAGPHNGNAVALQCGQFVGAGQPIGISGDSGTSWDHLHFEINHYSKNIDPSYYLQNLSGLPSLNPDNPKQFNDTNRNP